MTPDFAEGVISQCERVIANIKDRLASANLSTAARELEMLAEAIRMDMQEAERAE